MPTYITLKDVKKRWGHGQEDIFPVTQFEKLWVDMTALPEVESRFVVVPRLRGQQLKGPGPTRRLAARWLSRLCREPLRVDLRPAKPLTFTSLPVAWIKNCEPDLHTAQNRAGVSYGTSSCLAQGDL